MAAALGSRLRLAAPLTRVEHSPDGVRVYAAGQQPIDAAWLVLATPPGPLRAVSFEPGLPASVAAAVAGLDLGPAVKVMRQYDPAFWLAEGFSGFTLTDLPFTVAWATTDSQLATNGILTEFVTGNAARHAAELSEAARGAEFFAQLDEVYPEARDLAAGNAASMAWPNEAYTGGGYAVYRPGQLAPFFSTLRDGTGRIRFAGEHTCALAGYMESAVRSGHRVAAQLGPPPPP